MSNMELIYQIDSEQLLVVLVIMIDRHAKIYSSCQQPRKCRLHYLTKHSHNCNFQSKARNFQTTVYISIFFSKNEDGISLSVCSSQGQHYGWTRLQCDNAFFWDMSKLCLKRFFFLKHCLKYAGIYYGAVRVGGNKHYDVPSKSQCNMCPSYNGDHSLRVPLFRRRQYSKIIACKEQNI